MERIVFQPIRTPEGYYIYDRSVNTIFAVSPDDYENLNQIQDEDDVDDSPVVKRFRHMGLLGENRVTMIQHPYTEMLPHFCSSSLSSMVLQVTQQCNLRCSYCAYSGAYHNRTHNSAKMCRETAKKAIDFFLERAKESTTIHLGFYGGEPLLEFDLIQWCVEYIRNQVEGKGISFGLTTNGTLLTDEIIKFLFDNDFYVTISIDGPKEEHDACRVFPNGKGSFDLVMENIQRIKELYPGQTKKFSVSTVVSPKSDLNHVLDYFSTDEILSDTQIMIASLTPNGLKEEVNYQESYYQVRRYEYLKLLLSMLGKLDSKYVSQLVQHARRTNEQLYRALQRHTKIPERIHHGGPCIPSVKKLFVMTDGNLFPCEKISESVGCAQIGTLDEGFDLQKIEDLLNIGSLTASECKNCWVLPNCKICAAQLEYVSGQKKFTKEDKLPACKQSKMNVMADLYELCVLHEFGYRLNEEVIIL